MGLGDFIAGIFSPAVDLIDEIHVSDEERGKLKNELANIQNQALAKMADVEKARYDAMSKVQVAEAGSKFWLTATWRPMASILLIVVIVLSSFGWIASPGPDFYDLAQIFLGGYTASRGLEKMASSLGRK